MTEHPILFSGPMVRAILEGRKTQTRRVLKPQPNEVGAVGIISLPDQLGDSNLFYFESKSGKIGLFKPPFIKCPYGAPGDSLWVRETWHPRGEYRATPWENANGRAIWKPSIHMPKWASRITLEITEIRVERLQDISEEDAIAEGSQIPCAQLPKSCQQGTMTERCQFSKIWETINGKKYPWSRNPWVWVIEFKKA